MFATKKQPVIFHFPFGLHVQLYYDTKINSMLSLIHFLNMISKHDFIILDFMFCLICLIHSVVFSYYFKHRNSCLY